jgi:hypothetical protein
MLILIFFRASSFGFGISSFAASFPPAPAHYFSGTQNRCLSWVWGEVWHGTEAGLAPHRTIFSSVSSAAFYKNPAMEVKKKIMGPFPAAKC